MFKVLTFTATTFIVSSFAMQDGYAATITKPKGVVELFTSQGCHSCPPADKIVGEFSESDEILAISRHVDYWDYLGWKDIFASKENTDHQYQYARMLQERQVYTPQAIINGRSHAVGSQKAKIEAQIDKFAKTQRGMTVPLDIKIGSNSLTINIADHPEARDATLFVFSMKSEQEVKIPKGENAGKTLTYHNVLHEVQPLGMMTAKGLSMEYPIAELQAKGYDCYAFILQTKDKNGNPSAIVGAALIEDL